jgi:hypothetical protein
VAVEVFEGNTADPMTLSAQIDKLKARFGLSRVVLVGDRGMITSARIHDELKPAGLDWITALRASQIRSLLDTGAFQLSLFDERDLAEITAPEFPGERLVVCKNPLLAEERARKREDLLQATEAAFGKLAEQFARGTGPKTRSPAPSAASRTATSSPSCSTSPSPPSPSAADHSTWGGPRYRTAALPWRPAVRRVGAAKCFVYSDWEALLPNRVITAVSGRLRKILANYAMKFAA